MEFPTGWRLVLYPACFTCGNNMQWSMKEGLNVHCVTPECEQSKRIYRVVIIGNTCQILGAL